MSNTAVQQSYRYPLYGRFIGLNCVLTSMILFLTGCAGLPTESATDNPAENRTAAPERYQETSYAEYVFRRQNDVADRCMFLIEEETQLTDVVYEDIRQREESMYDACQYINEIAVLRSQQEEESWLLKVKTFLTLGQCEAAANELDSYILNLQIEVSPTALGALQDPSSFTMY